MPVLRGALWKSPLDCLACPNRADALQEGYFDAEGNYVSYRTDVVKDAWLDTLGEGERQPSQWSMLACLLTAFVLTARHSSHALCLRSQRFQS